jgi:hypothetical protein
MVLRGEVGLKADFFVYQMTAPPGACTFAWHNRGPQPRGPQRLAGEQGVKDALDIWSKEAPDTPAARAAQKALRELADRWGDRKPAVVLAEAAADESPARRAAAVLALGALDELPRLLDVLDDPGPARQADRDLAVFALRRYLSRGPEAAKALYDAKAQAGAFSDKKYKPREAATALELLYDFPQATARAPETFQFLLGLMAQEERVSLRELAHWHLLRLAQPVKLPEYNAAWPVEKRRAAVAEVKKLVEDGKLPPR